MDPIAKEYAELTPYQFASNRPIDGIDLDGLEFMPGTYDYKNSLYVGSLTTPTDKKLTQAQIEEFGMAMNKGHSAGLLVGYGLAWDMYTGGRISQALALQQLLSAFEHNRAKTPEGRAAQDQRSKEALSESFIAWGTGKIVFQAFSYVRGVFQETAKYLFRGTSKGYPGSRASQILNTTPTSTDPAVATAFAVQAKNYGEGTLQIALPVDLKGIKVETNVLYELEREVGVGISPMEFSKKINLQITADQARGILKEMGINVPASIPTTKNISEVLRDIPKLKQDQIDKFYSEAIKIGKNGQ